MTANSTLFYDIPSKDGKPWSPNTYKTRFVLNYKRIPYTTEWIEYPDIAPKFKTLGMTPNPPTAMKLLQAYTCPAISDSSTSPPTLVMDSASIATYLDAKYPSRPLYIGSPTSQAAQRKLTNLCESILQRVSIFIMMPATVDNLNPTSAEYVSRTRQHIFGCDLDAFLEGAKGVETWQNFDNGLEELHVYIESLQEPGLELLSAKDEDGTEGITYAGLRIVSMMIWIQMFGPIGAWERVTSSKHGALWVRLFEEAEVYR